MRGRMASLMDIHLTRSKETEVTRRIVVSALTLVAASLGPEAEAQAGQIVGCWNRRPVVCQRQQRVYPCRPRCVPMRRYPNCTQAPACSPCIPPACGSVGACGAAPCCEQDSAVRSGVPVNSVAPSIAELQNLNAAITAAKLELERVTETLARVSVQVDTVDKNVGKVDSKVTVPQTGEGVGKAIGDRDASAKKE